MADSKTPTPRPGQVWKRRDGSRFVIDHIKNGAAVYWLDRGNRPQYRSIDLDRLKPPAYRLVELKSNFP